MAAVGGVAMSAAASSSVKVKNVAKKSTTKPAGFTKSLLRNGSFDSSNAPSPCSNGSADSRRSSPAIEMNGKMSPMVATVGNGGDHSNCSSDSNQKVAPLSGGEQVSHAVVAAELDGKAMLSEAMPEMEDAKESNSESQSHAVKSNENSNASTCATNHSNSLPPEESIVSSEKCSRTGDSAITKTNPFESNTNDEKENKLENNENTTSNLNSEQSCGETDNKCDIDAMDSSNSGSSTRNVLSLANIKDSFKGIIKKAVSKVSSGSPSPLPDLTIELNCSSPDSNGKNVDKANSLDNLNAQLKSASLPPDTDKDKEDVVDPPKDDTLDSNMDKEMEMELDKMESGNVDDIDDSILYDSLENNDTKACEKEKEEAKREVTGHMEDVCNKTESEEIKNDKPTQSPDITAREECKAEESNFNLSDKSIDSQSDTEVACSEKESVKDEVTDQTESRKRAASSDGSASVVKKSRLDSVIGRLGSHIGVRPDDSPSDETDASPVEHCKPMAETKSEIIISKESESSNEPATKDNQRTIKLTKKRLDKIMANRLSAYLNSTQDSVVSKLKQRINELSSANEAWKAQVLELKKQIIDITVIHQRHERRRTLPARVQSRNFSIQVDETKIQAATQGLVQKVTPSGAKVSSTAKPGTPKTTGLAGAPTGVPTGAQASTPISVPLAAPSAAPQTMLIPMASTGGVAPGQAVTLLAPSTLPPASANLGSQIRMQLAAPPIAEAAKSGSAQTVREMLELKKKSPTSQTTTLGTVTGLTAGQSLLSKPAGTSVIDLTGDDDSAKARGAMVPTGLPPGVNLPPGVIRPGLSITGLQPGTFVLRQASAGAPMILQPISNAQVRNAAPGTTVLYTTRPNAPMSMPGQALTTVARTSAPMPTYTVPAQVQMSTQALRSPPANARTALKHPAPLPAIGVQKSVPGKSLPPKPTLKINRVQQGIVLSWNMTATEGLSDVTNYQLFAYQEGAATPAPALWKKVGDVKALPLPMACTLTQFQVGNKYHFAVRAADSYGRTGSFSDPGSIHLDKR